MEIIDFEAIMERFMSSKTDHKIQYCIFDIIYFRGKKVTQYPLVEKKALIDSIIEPTEAVTKVQWMMYGRKAYFNLVKQNELEGVVLKRAYSTYQMNKRSYDCLKVINYQYTDAYVTGMRKGDFGLLLSVEEDGVLKPGGIMEFMRLAAKKQFYLQSSELIVDENKKFIFLDSKIKCRVKFRNYTGWFIKDPVFC
ncbi:ATP-dependent DNA ligase [Neobacillus niacini]|uniref:ATP-dependent DNA ligase n=1 Tax=Neobacillus niacini TaxID=86668 RepID=UPI0027808915|nr:hypothetical protein [Neobacillus niacini]MDQ1005213.1 ATP-dependent DNA ligase [Neobacillus niacini]